MAPEQLDLGLPRLSQDPRYAYAEYLDCVIVAARDLIDHPAVTRKEVADLVDIQRSHLDNALNGGGDRVYLQVREILAALIRAPQDVRRRFFDALEDPLKPRLSAEEINERFEAEIRAEHSEARAQAIIDRARGRR